MDAMKAAGGPLPLRRLDYSRYETSPTRWVFVPAPTHWPFPCTRPSLGYGARARYSVTEVTIETVSPAQPLVNTESP